MKNDAIIVDVCIINRNLIKANFISFIVCWLRQSWV